MIEKWSDLAFWDTQTWEGIKKRLHTEAILPTPKNVFRALYLTPVKRVKAVILGQDPYHDGSGTGLAFSSNKPVKRIPRSLRNIFDEYEEDLKLPRPTTGSLEPWAEQGVLLLNTILTVHPGKPGSCSSWGWQELTSEVIQTVAVQNPHAVFILWGKEAQDMAIPLIGSCSRIVSPHPSPHSAYKGFFHSKPFTKTNALLSHAKQKPIDFRLK